MAAPAVAVLTIEVGTRSLKITCADPAATPALNNRQLYKDGVSVVNPVTFPYIVDGLEPGESADWKARFANADGATFSNIVSAAPVDNAIDNALPDDPQPRASAEVTPSDVRELDYVADELYIGNDGDLMVLTEKNDVVLFKAVPVGKFKSVKVRQVFATGTTAADIVASWRNTRLDYTPFAHA